MKMNAVENFSLAWENLKVNVIEKQSNFWTTKTTKKAIIHDISGFSNSNTLTAIMGSSGSGKSTFLGALSGINKDRQGTLKINGHTLTNNMLKNLSGYVQQEDFFTDSLTIQEHMKFMATMKLNKTNYEREIITEKLISELSLEKHKHTRIKYLSGGEKRRLSLASVLISDPLILFCDEPTTGLDSYNAEIVVKKLQTVAWNGKIVLFTVHQPSSQLFNYFDNIILLSSGYLICQGSKEEIQHFFETADLFCPISYNPADFYLNCITSNDDSIKSSILKLRESFENKVEEKVYNNCVHFENIMLEKKVFKKSFFYELKWLSWRAFIDTTRNINRFYLSALLTMITAVVLGFLFSKVKLNKSDSVQNIMGALNCLIAETIFRHMYNVIYVFPSEMTIFLNEKHLYEPLPYYLSKITTLIPSCTVNTLIFISAYFIQLQFLSGFDLFFYMFAYSLLVSLLGSGFGLCLSAYFSSIVYLEMVIVPLELVAMIVSGFWVKINTLPKYLTFLKYISPFYYGFQTISVLVWDNVGYFNNCTNTETIPCYETGEDVLNAYAFDYSEKAILYDILLTTLAVIFYCFIGYLGIIRKRVLLN